MLKNNDEYNFIKFTMRKLWAQSAMLLLLSLIMFVCLASCSKSQSGDVVARVETLTGQSVLEKKNGRKTFLKKDDFISVEDTIFSENGVVILNFQGEHLAEIQQNTVFRIEEYLKDKKNLHIKKGQAWLKIKKLAVNEELNLNSPDSVVAVRGTQFYSFTVKDKQGKNVANGLCVCEGKIVYSTKDKTFTGRKDQIFFYKDGKTVVITPKEFQSLSPSMVNHEHSLIENSPLGPKFIVDSAQAKALKALIEKKLNSL